jgi:hypothetical protein
VENHDLNWRSSDNIANNLTTVVNASSSAPISLDGKMRMSSWRSLLSVPPEPSDSVHPASANLAKLPPPLECVISETRTPYVFGQSQKLMENCNGERQCCLVVRTTFLGVILPEVCCESAVLRIGSGVKLRTGLDRICLGDDRGRQGSCSRLMTWWQL